MVNASNLGTLYEIITPYAFYEVFILNNTSAAMFVSINV